MGERPTSVYGNARVARTADGHALGEEVVADLDNGASRGGGADAGGLERGGVEADDGGHDAPARVGRVLHGLRADLDDGKRVGKRHGAGGDERSILAQAQPSHAHHGVRRHRGRVVPAQRRIRGQIGHKQRRLRHDRRVELRSGPIDRNLKMCMQASPRVRP